MLNTEGRILNKIVIGGIGEGRGFYPISDKTLASTSDEGVLFVKDDDRIVLTKEELIKEFKIGLEHGYFKKEDLF